MQQYNYYDAVLEDVKQHIEDNINFDEWRGKRDELEELLNDDLWMEDSVTGNGSGSYTFSTWEAEENLYHNLGLLQKVRDEFGGGCDILEDGAEACDVAIRCYLLGGAISEALDELEDAGAFDEDEDEQ